jgi:hypothetical protein
LRDEPTFNFSLDPPPKVDAEQSKQDSDQLGVHRATMAVFHKPLRRRKA